MSSPDLCSYIFFSRRHSVRKSVMQMERFPSLVKYRIRSEVLEEWLKARFGAGNYTFEVGPTAAL